MSYGWSARAADIETTSVTDGQTHTIGAADFDAGVWQGNGPYRAVCGAQVVAATLATCPGLRCRVCPPLPPQNWPRPGRLARSVARLTASRLDRVRRNHHPARHPRRQQPPAAGPDRSGRYGGSTPRWSWGRVVWRCPAGVIHSSEPPGSMRTCHPASCLRWWWCTQ